MGKETTPVENQTNLLVQLITPMIREAVDRVVNDILTRPVTGPEFPVTINQASTLVNKSVATLYCLHSRGQIPDYACRKHGKRLYFYPLGLMEWIKAGNNGNKV